MRLIWCPACNLPSVTEPIDSGREGQLCIRCKSNARQRSLILAAKIARRQIEAEGRLVKALGISDGPQTAKWAGKFFGARYLNTFFHQEPKLDLTKIPVQMHGQFNLVICSEVLEHIEPPVARAFLGLSQLLEVGGTVALSVPYTSGVRPHIEHFPELTEARLVESDSGLVWRGLNAEGLEECHTNLCFHGGVGSTLEFRVFSEQSLQTHLVDTGFVVLKKLQGSRFSGTHWQPWSRIWLVRKQ